MKLDAMVAPLRADVVSGASVIGRTAADVVRRAVEGSSAKDTGQLREMLVSLGIRIMEAQPAMAPLVAMVSEFIRSAEEGLPLPEARSRVLDSISSFKEGLEASTRAVADQAGGLLSTGARVLTLSFSSTVASTLTRFGPGHRIHVFCLEARPMTEGQRLARTLAQAGVGVTFAVDAAAAALAQQADLVFLGADSLGDQGLVNKVGSLPVALAAREAGVPVYALLDRTKLLPPGFPQTVADDRPEGEVWKAPHGIRVWNRYFELVPTELITEIVTEDGAFSPKEARSLRSRISIPSELRTWAAGRSS